MIQVSDKQEFIKLLEFLYEKKGISIRKISKEANIKYEKLISIRNGRSSGNTEDLAALREAYGDLLEAAGEQAAPTAVERRMEELEQEIKEKGEEIAELRKIVLNLANKMLEK